MHQQARAAGGPLVLVGARGKSGGGSTYSTLHAL
jgi:hypothetical protein